MYVHLSIVPKIFPKALCMILVWSLFTNCGPSIQTSDQAIYTPVVPNDFDQQLQEYESEDRVIWQKPGLILDLLQPLEGKTVADLGAGSGYFAFRVLDKADKVIALDIDPYAIQFMDSVANTLSSDSRPRFETRLVDYNDSKLQSEEVDIVLLVNTYSYLDDRVNYFKQLKRSLKDYGLVLIIDFKKKSLPIGPSPDQKLDQYLVEQELRSAGYQVILSDDRALDYQYIIKAVKLDEQ